MRAYHLGPGHVTAVGHGAAARLLDEHLLRCDGVPVGEHLVAIDFVNVVRGRGVVVRTRRGRAVVAGDDPVRISWPRRMTSTRPLIVAAEHAAARRGAVMLAGAVAARGERAALIVGASGAGKTAVLLDAVRDGAAEIAGTEWSWVDPSTATAWPLPQPLRIRPHHIERLGRIRDALTAGQYARMRAAGRLPERFRRRLFVDLPFASIAVRRIRPVVIERIIAIGDGDPPGIRGATVVREAPGGSARIDW